MRRAHVQVLKHGWVPNAHTTQHYTDTDTRTHLLTLLKEPEERGECANVEGVGGDAHNVVEDARELAKEGADVLGTLRHLNVQQLLNRKRVRLCTGWSGVRWSGVEWSE